MNLVNQYFSQIFMLLILALAAFLGTQARNLYRRYVTTEIKQSVCRTAVRFVEQIYVDLHGPEKLAQAMAKASEILEGYGITIREDELIAMIEAAVNEFNNAFGAKAGKHLPAAQPAALYGNGVEDPDDRAPEAETGSPATVEEIIADIVGER